MRKEFTETTEKLIKENNNSALLLGDIGVFNFRELLTNYPGRAFNLGILEQSMIGVGAGLASEGVIPIIHSIAPFLIERSLEQIKVDFGYQRLPGNLVSVGASFDYAKLGCTHHCPADITILSNIPGINLFIPGHGLEFKSHFMNYWNSGSLNYFRLSEVQNDENFDLKVGEIKKIKNGSAAVVIAVGPFLNNVIEGLSDLDLEIHYVNSIVDSVDMVICSDFPGKKVVLYEPYYSGPLLMKVFQQLNQSKCSILQIGVPKKFIEEYGTYNEHLINLELDSVSLRRRISEFIS